MELRVTLAPDGGLRLILPTGRPLDVGATASSVRFIQRILMDVRQKRRDQRGYVGEFPTQHVIEIWKKQDEEGKRLAAVERIKEMGIELDKLDISL